jgi:DNA-binding helix-hairpin-helix protein with protein kinase domain
MPRSWGKPVSKILLLRWLRDLCDALWALHQVGLVHGDVSPRNIIVQGGEVVLTDYDTVSEAGARCAAAIPCMPATVSRAVRRSRRTDDLFALAASFFHVLFDKDPFDFGGQRIKNRRAELENVVDHGA